MKRLFCSIITLLLNTSIVFASPSMKGYAMPKARKAQIAKIQSNAKESRLELIENLEKTISSLSSKPSKNKVNQDVIKKIDDAFYKGHQERKQYVGNLLKSPNDFTRAFNDSKALDRDLTQYDFKQNLLSSIDTKESKEALDKLHYDLKKAGSLSNFLTDLKVALENNNESVFLSHLFKNTAPSRSIASGPLAGWITVIVLGAIVAVLTVASTIAGITTLATSGAVVLGLAYLLPAFIVITVVGVVIYNS